MVIQTGQEFCERILNTGLGKANAVWTFNGAGLELLRHARSRGMLTIMEQTIAPKAVESEFLAMERARWPGWEDAAEPEESVRNLIAREAAEWEASDLIVCGSDFVRDGLAHSGGPVGRCVVVPYGVDARPRTSERLLPDGPLRVLTVGEIGLRKGTPYLVEAAQELQGTAVFRAVGGVSHELAERHGLTRYLELPGTVPRSEMHELYTWADVLLLPSICEGSATATYEALAAGLPVICTQNTGSVVRDGIDGFIVPIRDTDAIVERLRRLSSKPKLRAELAANARRRSLDYDVASYGRRLLDAIHSAQPSREAH
jgi:glycosyltransferase involved in cell wall biosynthesis